LTPARPPGGRAWIAPLANWTALLAVVVAFCVSSMALAALGVSYSATGGSALLKLHPANWLFALALLLNVLGKSDRGAYLAQLPRAFPGAAFFIAMWAFIVVFAVAIQHTPVTPVIDTFFAALAMLVLYDDLDARCRDRIRLVLHAIMLANACLGIFEFLTQFRLTPFVVGDTLILTDPRSTALLGHPLLNAGVTGGYVLMLFFSGAAPGGPFVRAGAILVQLAAMIAFGGRAAIVLTLGFVLLGSLSAIGGALNGRPFDRRIGFAFALGLPMLIAASAAALSYGLFGALIERFVDDKGSAQARVVLFELFGDFSLEDLLLGPDPERLASLQNTLGIEFGIENSWLGLMFQYGAMIATFFIVGLLALLAELSRRSRPTAILIIVHFLLLASASASISVKSVGFNLFAILLIAVFGRGVGEREARRIGAATAGRRSPGLSRA